MKLWQYGKISGVWRLINTYDTPTTAQEWYRLSCIAEPHEIFRLSVRRPRGRVS